MHRLTKKVVLGTAAVVAIAIGVKYGTKSSEVGGARQAGEPTGSDRQVVIAVTVDACGHAVTKNTMSGDRYDALYAEMLRRARAFADTLRVQSASDHGPPSRSVFQFAAFHQQRAPVPLQDAGTPSLIAGRPEVAAMSDSSHSLSDRLKLALLSTQRVQFGESVTQQEACRGAASPEVQDGQRLIVGDSAFGPVAQIVTRPGVDLKSLGDYDADYRLAAFIEVTLDSGMTAAQYSALKEYQALNLSPGINCLFLRHRGGQWDARMTQAPLTAGCDSTKAGAATHMEVITSGVGAAKNSPPTSRFVEGSNNAPLIGVRCADSWCLTGPLATVHPVTPAHLSLVGGVKPMRLPYAPPVNSQSDIGLWGDEQHLMEIDAGGVRKPAFRASIVPDANLAKISVEEYAKRWVHVASVYSPDVPPATYVKEFGYGKGWNRIYLQRAGEAYFSLIIDASGQPHLRSVINYPHTYGNSIGTARFDWVETDEWVWIPCADGCCLVENGRDF